MATLESNDVMVTLKSNDGKDFLIKIGLSSLLKDIYTDDPAIPIPFSSIVIEKVTNYVNDSTEIEYSDITTELLHLVNYLCFEGLLNELCNVILIKMNLPKSFNHKNIIEYCLKNDIDNIFTCNIKNDAKEIFDNACKDGDMDTVKFMIQNDTPDFNSGLYHACQGGHMIIIDLLIEEGADDWDLGLDGACEGGHMDIVTLMSEKDAQGFDSLYHACKGGNRDSINFLVEQAAKDWRRICDWDRGLVGACEGGHIDLVKLIIEDTNNTDGGANDLQHIIQEGINDLPNITEEDVNDLQHILQQGINDLRHAAEDSNTLIDGLEYACKGGHMDIVKLLIEKGANYWNGGLYAACDYGHMDIAKLMIENGAVSNNKYKNLIGNYKKLILLMLDKNFPGLCEDLIHKIDTQFEEYVFYTQTN
jgi:ankyrin repeat protein